MGGIAAALNRHGEDSVSSVLLMLQEIKHRGADGIQVLTPTSAVAAKTSQEIENKKMRSNIAVGQNFSQSIPKENSEIFLKKDYGLAFDGRVFPISDIQEIVHELKQTPQKAAEHIIRRFDGAYTFAIILPDKIIGGRDLLGVSPLYIGQNETTCAMASERKAIWMLGIGHVKSLPPGTLATMTSKGFTFKAVATLTKPAQKAMSLEKAAHRLNRLLLRSTMERVSELEKISVAFSGGLDSSVIAVLAKICAKNVTLITVGLENQPELWHAKAAADALELPIQIQAFTIADVENALKKVLWLIEEPDVMKVGVAIPLFWTAQTASKIGASVLFSGQGADELFGGYHKYQNKYVQGGVQAVQKAMFHDLVYSYEANFQRDNPICAFYEVELRLPFIDHEVVRFALSLSVNLKIASAGDNLQKRVLRQVAKDMSIPPFISEKTKKAVQYTTGVDRVIKKLAQKKGLSKKDYVKQVFEEIYPDLKERE